ncbi:hypothetical protein Anapl_02294 [Anas platyrhynchos]|uniref:Uncharacterized protein n=1 Tax=Anas platyrhynchos TaxID=8839 RepID=R0M3U6_ANAPL|nr:hypothetical protein Anapl_02294 [Anas platyrhynchos]
MTLGKKRSEETGFATVIARKRGQIGSGTGTEAAWKKHEDAQEMQRHQRQAIGLVPSAHFVIVSLTPEQYSPETKDVTQEAVGSAWLGPHTSARIEQEKKFLSRGARGNPEEGLRGSVSKALDSVLERRAGAPECRRTPLHSASKPSDTHSCWDLDSCVIIYSSAIAHQIQGPSLAAVGPISVAGTWKGQGISDCDDDITIDFFEICSYTHCGEDKRGLAPFNVSVNSRANLCTNLDHTAGICSIINIFMCRLGECKQQQIRAPAHSTAVEDVARTHFQCQPEHGQLLPDRNLMMGSSGELAVLMRGPGGWLAAQEPSNERQQQSTLPDCEWIGEKEREPEAKGEECENQNLPCSLHTYFGKTPYV